MNVHSQSREKETQIMARNLVALDDAGVVIEGMELIRHAYA